MLSPATQPAPQRSHRAINALYNAGTDQPNLPALIPSTGTEGGRLLLVRRTAAGFEEEEIATPSLSAAGLFVELACEGQRATILLETAQGRERFLLEDPSKINLVAADGAHVQDVQCGPQSQPRSKSSIVWPKAARILTDSPLAFISSQRGTHSKLRLS
jgi:hypothetical protein